MREVKFISHLSRNIYIFFLLFVTNFLLFKIPLSFQIFTLGLITYFISYAPVYFINDFVDYEEDSKLKKSNLYLLFKNKSIFWITLVILVLVGWSLSYIISPVSLGIVLLLYILNCIYSLPPIRLRNRPFLREILIFIIYFTKWILVSVYLHYAIQKFPISIVIMSCSLASFAVALYKRLILKSELAEYVFGMIFLISWVWTIFVYKSVFWLFFPLVPLAIFMQIKYKKKPMPLGFLQFIYFCYTILVFLVSK